MKRKVTEFQSRAMHAIMTNSGNSSRDPGCSSCRNACTVPVGPLHVLTCKAGNEITAKKNCPDFSDARKPAWITQPLWLSA